MLAIRPNGRLVSHFARFGYKMRFGKRDDVVAKAGAIHSREYKPQFAAICPLANPEVVTDVKN